ncbi:MAG: TrkA family potassium uptake protein, partial [Candidatus Omnitrophota bacterium]
LGADFNGLTITGNGFDVDLLKEAGIEQTDAFCAVTDSDNANIMSGQVAKKIFNIAKVIARINDPQYSSVYTGLGIEIVNSTALLASTIRNKIIESKFSNFLLENRFVDTMELPVGEKIAGKRVEELNLPGALIVAAIIKNKEDIVIPQLSDKVEKGNVLIAVVRTENLSKIKKFFDV